jgi:multidrug efflux pump subunit AcrB
LRIITDQQPVEAGNCRGFRAADARHALVLPDLAVVHGAEVPQPYGGKPRVIMADLDPRALAARGLSPSNVIDALQRQNVILPAGDVKIGSKDHALSMNNSPDVIDSINAFPVAQVGGNTVFMRDIAHVHDGFQVQTNSVTVDDRSATRWWCSCRPTTSTLRTTCGPCRWRPAAMASLARC